MLATASAIGMPGILMVPLKNEFGWDTSAISGALALRLLIFGLMGPFGAAALMQRATACAPVVWLGARHDRVRAGARHPDDGAVAALAAPGACMLGLSTGVTANVLGATVANRWFTERRGLVVGLLERQQRHRPIAVPAGGGLVVDHMGWRLAMVLAAGAVPGLPDAGGAGACAIIRASLNWRRMARSLSFRSPRGGPAATR